jgi:hypothetical protein
MVQNFIKHGNLISVYTKNFTLSTNTNDSPTRRTTNTSLGPYWNSSGYNSVIHALMLYRRSYVKNGHAFRII